MYFSPTKIHPSVQIILDRQKVGKPTRQTLMEQEESHSLILEVEKLDLIDDIIVPLDKNHAFILNENDVYELVRLDESFVGDMIRGAMKWLRGNVSKLLNKWFPKETDQQALYKAYQKDPKQALDYVRNRMEGQGLKPEQIDREVKKIRNGINREIAARHGVKTRDANMINAISGIGKALQKSGGDPAAQMTAVRQMMGGNVGQAFQKAMQSLPGGVPAKGGKAPAQPAQQAQPSAQPPVQQPAKPAVQAQPAAQTPAITHMGFKEGDKVYTVDANKKTIEGVVVKTDQAMADELTKKGFTPAPLMVDVNGNKQVLTQSWKVGPAPTAQPPETSQTQGPGGKLPPGDIQIGGSYVLNGAKVDIKPGSISTNMEGVASLVKQYKTGKVSGIVDGQEVELDSLTASGGELGANLSLSKGGAAPTQGAAQPTGLTKPETGPAAEVAPKPVATPAAAPAKPLTPAQIVAQQATAKTPITLAPAVTDVQRTRKGTGVRRTPK